jgi:hypothetical protein
MKEVRNLSHSVHDRLLNLVHREQQPYDLVLVRYALERLLHRLSCSEYQSQWAAFSRKSRLAAPGLTLSSLIPLLAAFLLPAGPGRCPGAVVCGYMGAWWAMARRWSPECTCSPKLKLPRPPA